MLSLLSPINLPQLNRGSGKDCCNSEGLPNKINPPTEGTKFLACRTRIPSVKELQKLELTQLKEKISGLQKKIVSLSRGKKTERKQLALHTKKRRLACLESRRIKKEEMIKEGVVSMCFGGKKLFRAQFFLEKNGFNSHEEWKQARES